MSIMTPGESGRRSLSDVLRGFVSFRKRTGAKRQHGKQGDVSDVKKRHHCVRELISTKNSLPRHGERCVERTGAERRDAASLAVGAQRRKSRLHVGGQRDVAAGPAKREQRHCREEHPGERLARLTLLRLDKSQQPDAEDRQRVESLYVCAQKGAQQSNKSRNKSVA